MLILSVGVVTTVITIGSWRTWRGELSCVDTIHHNGNADHSTASIRITCITNIVFFLLFDRRHTLQSRGRDKLERPLQLPQASPQLPPNCRPLRPCCPSQLVKYQISSRVKKTMTLAKGLCLGGLAPPPPPPPRSYSPDTVISVICSLVGQTRRALWARRAYHQCLFVSLLNV